MFRWPAESERRSTADSAYRYLLISRSAQLDESWMNAGKATIIGGPLPRQDCSSELPFVLIQAQAPPRLSSCSALCSIIMEIGKWIPMGSGFQWKLERHRKEGGLNTPVTCTSLELKKAAHVGKASSKWILKDRQEEAAFNDCKGALLRLSRCGVCHKEYTWAVNQWELDVEQKVPNAFEFQEYWDCRWQNKETAAWKSQQERRKEEIFEAISSANVCRRFRHAAQIA